MDHIPNQAFNKVKQPSVQMPDTDLTQLMVVHTAWILICLYRNTKYSYPIKKNYVSWF